MFKNIDKQAKLCLKDLVDYRDGQIVSRTLVQNNLVSMTLFSFDKNEEISKNNKDILTIQSSSVIVQLYKIKDKN